jgi:uncharacterized membrane protein YcaP (DUF421 family)
MNTYVEVALKSVAIYIFIVLAIRFFGKKELSQLSVIDLVFILLISNSVQNAMVGTNTSLLGGIVAALSLFIVNFFLKKILYKYKKINQFIQGNAILLVYNGKIQHHNLNDVDLSIDELEAATREHGVQDIQHVKLAMLEIDGNISIISGEAEKHTIYNPKNKQKLKGRIIKS